MFFKYLLVIALTVLLTLGCVCGFSCVSCEGSEEDTDTETAEILSVNVLSDDYTEENTPDEDEPVEAERWVKIVFDVAVIAMSVGVIVLAIWAVKRVMRRYGGGRCF